MQFKEFGKDYTSSFAGDWTIKNPLNAPQKDQATLPKDRMRWSIWAKGMNGEALVRWVRDEVFPFYAEVADRSAMNFMDGARLGVDEPTVLSQVVTLIDGLRLDQADADSKGDLFEHVLKQIKQAGELGQFRTPRHIIRAIVAIIDPKIGETVYDPAAGTAGFLVAAYNHIRLANSSAHAVEEVEIDGKVQQRGHGDRLSQKQFAVLQNETFFGNDVDPKMVRLGTMNLSLRGLANVRILKRNVLTTTLERAQKAGLDLPLDGYDVVLANPPFSGKVDKDRVVDDVNVYVRSEKAGARVMASVAEFLRSRLHLQVNREKSAVAPVGERKFLGHRLLPDGNPIIAPESLWRMKQRVRAITRRNRGISLARMIAELNAYMAGWVTYFRHARCQSRLRDLDAWIRRKLRCLRLKHCKRAKAQADFLQSLGVPEWRAWILALSGKGWWRKALSYQATEAMTLAWFQAQGLVPLLDRHSALQTEGNRRGT